MNYLNTAFASLVLWGALNVLPSAAFASDKIRIVVSVDWEGRRLDLDNLQAMQKFRKDYPEVKLQHFLNAAYYTKKGANSKKITRLIRSVLKEGDEHGLHVHSWKSLVEASGVNFRTGPSFVYPEADLSACDFDDCGHDIAINAYSKDELRSILRFSVDTLQSHGFDRAKSFRAGGWQADNKVLSALAAEGFTLDSSATDAEFLFEKWGNLRLYPMVGELWPETRTTSQPSLISTESGDILELPNNGCLADYTTAEVIADSFQKNVDFMKQNPGKDVYLSIGFHQETAARYLSELRKGIDLIKEKAALQTIDYEFVVGPAPMK